ncbi:Uncharacterised protein [Hafnia alvei]|nr:Uncharacterised protein [Hafnia alvei]
MYLLSNSTISFFFLLHLILLAIGFIIAYAQAKKIDILGVFFVACVYCFLNFSRTGFGVDEPVYLGAYKDYLRDGTLYFEYSFNFLYFLFSKIGITSELFNYVFSTVFILISGITIVYCTSRPYQTLAFVFFLFFSITLDFVFNAYRQGMAFLFVMLFLHYYNKEMRKKAILFLLSG